MNFYHRRNIYQKAKVISSSAVGKPIVNKGPWKRYRKPLQEEFASLEQFDNLVKIASTQLVHTRLRRYALELGEQAIRENRSIVLQAQLTTRLLPRYRQINGHLEEARLSAAKELLRKLAAMERLETDAERLKEQQRSWSYLHSTVLRECSHLDLDGALEHTRRLGGSERLRALGEITRSLSRRP